MFFRVIGFIMYEKYEMRFYLIEMDNLFGEIRYIVRNSC